MCFYCIFKALTVFLGGATFIAVAVQLLLTTEIVLRLGCLYNLILIVFSALGLGGNIGSGVEDCGILNLDSGESCII